VRAASGPAADQDSEFQCVLRAQHITQRRRDYGHGLRGLCRLVHGLSVREV
jgi:hypothetical protein